MNATSTDAWTFGTDGTEVICCTIRCRFITSTSTSIMHDEDDHVPGGSDVGVSGPSSKDAIKYNSTDVAYVTVNGDVTSIL